MEEIPLNGNTTGRMLIDDARRLTVDAVRLRDAAELIRQLDMQVHDPESHDVIRLLNDMGARYESLARRLKLVAVELERPSPSERVATLDAVLSAYFDERAASREAMGGGA